MIRQLFRERCEAASLTPELSEMSKNILADGPPDASTTVILAHGAGAGMDSEFMQVMAEGLAGQDLRVVRFEFPYMARGRETGRRGGPDRPDVLRAAWLDVIQTHRTRRTIIGGKSMGGRIASLIADEAEVDGLVCLGYPFHPTGRPEKLRVEHLKDLQTKTLIVQGERDPFGKREEIRAYKLSDAIQMHWMTDGDHSFKPRKSSGTTQTENWDDCIRTVDRFVKRI